MEANLPDP